MLSVDELLQRLPQPGGSPLSLPELAAMQSEYPHLPAEYWEFLHRIGHGEIGIIIYSGPVPARVVYGLKGDRLPGIVLIGDDGQGYCFGFDTQDECQFVIVTDDAQIVRPETKTALTDIVAEYSS